MVPAATTRRVPSTSWATELWPPKPRADRLLPPLPGAGASLMPGMRMATSWARVRLRSAMSAAPSVLTLAGVSRALRPRREPVPLLSSSDRPAGAWRDSVMWTVARGCSSALPWAEAASTSEAAAHAAFFKRKFMTIPESDRCAPVSFYGRAGACETARARKRRMRPHAMHKPKPEKQRTPNRQDHTPGLAQSM